MLYLMLHAHEDMLVLTEWQVKKTSETIQSIKNQIQAFASG